MYECITLDMYVFHSVIHSLTFTRYFTLSLSLCHSLSHFHSLFHSLTFTNIVNRAYVCWRLLHTYIHRLDSKNQIALTSHSSSSWEWQLVCLVELATTLRMWVNIPANDATLAHSPMPLACQHAIHVEKGHSVIRIPWIVLYVLLESTIRLCDRLLSLSHTLTLYYSLTHSLSYSRTLTLYYSLTHSLTLSFSPLYKLSLTLSHSHTLILSLV